MLSLLVALLFQSPAPCEASSPYDEAWSVHSMLHTATLCREPAQTRDQAAIWYRLSLAGEPAWRRAFPDRFLGATVSSDGWTAAWGPVDAALLVQRVLAIDPLGQTVVDQPILLAPPGLHDPGPRARVLQLVISDRSRLLVVRRTNELWQRISLVNGEELASVDMYARLREGGMPSGKMLEAAAIEGRPFFVLHVVDGDSSGGVRSVYLVLDVDLYEWARVEVPRPEYRALDEARDALRRDSARMQGTLRIDRASELRIRRGDAWIDWALRDTEEGALELVELGPADPAAGSDD